jgi:hypothetical protein
MRVMIVLAGAAAAWSARVGKRREEFWRELWDVASPLRTERLAQASLRARRQGFRASGTEPGRPGGTILRSVEPGSALRGIRRGDAGGIRGIRRGRVVRTRPNRKPSRQDHPESRSCRAASQRGVDQAGKILGRASSVAVGIVRSRGGPGPAAAGMSLARRSRR